MYCNAFPMALMMPGSGLRLYISRHTVSRHIRNLCKKCGAKNSIHLIVMFSGLSSLQPHQALTRRENEVVALLAQGMTQKTVADAMGLSFSTVCKHRENILIKLKVCSMRAAVALLCRPDHGNPHQGRAL